VTHAQALIQIQPQFPFLNGVKCQFRMLEANHYLEGAASANRDGASPRASAA